MVKRGPCWTNQFPLKSVRADAGIGKIDLLGLHKDGTLAVVELKDGDTSQPVPMYRVSEAAYREDLHRRFWDYRRTSFAAEGDLFDPNHSEEKSPPVFRRVFAERNLLLPSTAGSGIRAAITAMVPLTERHRWFASMSSSQALAQSVFASLATLGRLDALENLASRDGYPAFFETADLYQLKLEHQVATLGEPRPTSVDVFFSGPQKAAVEVKFTEAEFGRLRPEEAGFAQDHCDGSFSVQRDRQSRCSLSERGILY
jgi:hypothetical protein